MSGALKIADRLMVDPLKQAILSRIRLDWPSTLEEWDARRAFYPKTVIGIPTYPDPAPVIQIARLYDSSLLVPTLFYELSTRDPGNGARWDLVSEQDRVLAFAGRKCILERLSVQLSGWAWDKRWLCVNEEDSCAELQLRLFIETHNSLFSDGDILRGLKSQIGVWHGYYAEDDPCCRDCASAMDFDWSQLRNDIFEEFPKFFIGYL